MDRRVDEPPFLLIVDLSNLASRGYHAAASSDAKRGAMLVGLAKHNLKRMMQTLLREAEPLRIVAACDSGRCFRHDLYPAYKGHRGERDPEYLEVIAQAPDLMRAEFGAEILSAPGFEADDVIATVADASLPYGWRTGIVSNDGDLLQLVVGSHGGPGTFVLHYDKGVYRSLDEAAVKANKNGVPPHRVALFKALAGDASDGIPGAVGIGPVSARRLALVNPSVEKIFARLDDPRFVTAADRKKLIANGPEHLSLMETLTTLRRDAPLTLAA